MFCTSYYVVSPSITVLSSINLYIGFSQAVALPYVWGQLIYMLLVSCLIFWEVSPKLSGTRGRNLIQRIYYVTIRMNKFIEIQDNYFWVNENVSSQKKLNTDK